MDFFRLGGSRFLGCSCVHAVSRFIQANIVCLAIDWVCIQVVAV